MESKIFFNESFGIFNKVNYDKVYIKNSNGEDCPKFILQDKSGNVSKMLSKRLKSDDDTIIIKAEDAANVDVDMNNPLAILCYLDNESVNFNGKEVKRGERHPIIFSDIWLIEGKNESAIVLSNLKDDYPIYNYKSYLDFLSYYLDDFKKFKSFYLVLPNSDFSEYKFFEIDLKNNSLSEIDLENIIEKTGCEENVLNYKLEVIDI